MPMDYRQILNNEQFLRDLVKDVFQATDLDQSGYLDLKELGEILTQINPEIGGALPTEEEIQLTMNEIDLSKDGKISEKELLLLIRSILEKLINKNV